MSVIFSLVANAQMYLDVVSPLKHLGSVASKDVICDNEGNPCAKIMFEISVDDVVFSSPNIVGSATKKTGRYECFVSVPKTQNVNITLTHHSYGSVIVPLYCEGQPLVSREAYHVKIESKVFESYSSKYALIQKKDIPELKNLDTRYVCNMSYMFFYCEKLKNLNVSHFNTTNVETMFAMFEGCRRLTSLDLSNFNTSKVTNMSCMFADCLNLTPLDLSNFNTSKVTNMSEMFRDCNSLTSLNLSNFNTSNVKDMQLMFLGCGHLTSLDLSNFNISADANCMFMFGHDHYYFGPGQVLDGRCKSLKTIKVTNCNQTTINKIKEALREADILNQVRLVR